MIEKYPTEQFGLNGLAMSYYTGRDTEGDIYIDVPQGIEADIESPEYHSFKLSFPVSRDAQPFVHSLSFINLQLKSVYSAFEQLRNPLNWESNIAAQYFLGMQSIIFFIGKAIDMCVFRECYAHAESKYKPFRTFNTNTLFQEFHNKDKEARDIYARLFIKANNKDLATTIETLKEIYFSINMYTNYRTIGTDYPTVTAIDSSREPGIEYIFHNHSLRQIIQGVNDFFTDIKLFARDERGDSE